MSARSTAAYAALPVFGASGTLGWSGLIGLGPITTALVGWCPGYLPLDITTCDTRLEG